MECTDAAAPSEGYSCGECPAGYTGDGETCEDTDGCAHLDTLNLHLKVLRRGCQPACLRPDHLDTASKSSEDEPDGNEAEDSGTCDPLSLLENPRVLEVCRSDGPLPLFSASE